MIAITAKQNINAVLFSFWILLFLLVGCKPIESQTAATDDKDKDTYHKIRVLTYNIQHGNTTSGEIDLDLYADIIKERNPDIVALQEVDNKARRSGYIDETTELAEKTGLKGYFGKYRDYQGGEFGDAILSRYPVLDFEVIPANSSLDSIPRSYIFAKLKIAEDTFIYFNDSHLSHRINEQATIQAEELTSYWKTELNQQPLIIAGDLNSVPTSDAMQELFKFFVPVDKDLNPTFSARTSPKRKIDYILYPDNTRWKVFKTDRICRKDASDHCAIFAVLGFKNN